MFFKWIHFILSSQTRRDSIAFGPAQYRLPHPTTLESQPPVCPQLFSPLRDRFRNSPSPDQRAPPNRPDPRSPATERGKAERRKPIVHESLLGNCSRAAPTPGRIRQREDGLKESGPVTGYWTVR